MPHYYQFYTSFKENEAELNIRAAVQQLNIPYLIVHGEKDETVLLQEASALENWNPTNQLEIIEEANHTFGSSHPWIALSLPKHLSQALDTSIDFLKG
jgi:pimeloyl-ACP methyl ester carboxylesterase